MRVYIQILTYAHTNYILVILLTYHFFTVVYKTFSLVAFFVSGILSSVHFNLSSTADDLTSLSQRTHVL